MRRSRVFRYGILTPACLLLASLGLLLLAGTQTKPASGQQPSKVLAASLDNVAPPAPAVDLSAQYNDELKNLIADWVTKQPQPTEWGVAVQGLVNTNISTSFQGEKSFQTASIYKLYMIYALSRLVPQSQWSRTLPGDHRTIDTCVSAMLMRSDNPCGMAMGNWLGWVKAEQLIKKAGYNHTVIDEVPLGSTALDTNKFMTDLYNGVTFGPALRDRMINDMKKSIFRTGIVAGCPGCSVANKTGNLKGYNHDSAIIEVDGRTFTLTIMSKGGSFAEIASLTRLIQQYIRSH